MLKLKLYSEYNQNNQGFETTILLGGGSIRHQYSLFLPFTISLVLLFMGSVGTPKLLAQDSYLDELTTLADIGIHGTGDVFAESRAFRNYSLAYKDFERTLKKNIEHPKPAIALSPPPTTISVQISSANDDAEESAADGANPGYMYMSSGDLEMVEDLKSPAAKIQTVGLRFNGLNLPQGATITDAYIDFIAKAADIENDNTSATSLIIEAEASDSAVSIATTDYYLSGLTTTSSSSAWNPAAWTDGITYASPDLSSVVQELVDRTGWIETNNSVLFIISGTGSRTTHSYDGNPANAPVLNITYSLGGNSQDAYYDEFTTLAYDGSDGTIDWSSSPWFEVGDGAGDIFTGAVAVRNSTRAYGGTGNTLKTSCGHANSAPGVYVYREVDLSTASSATLSFYLTHDLLGTDNISLEISNNGGSTWTVLKNYGASDPDPSNESFDISSFISPNTQIRFYINTIGSGGSIWTDNIKIEYTVSGCSSYNATSVFSETNVLNSGNAIGVADNIVAEASANAGELILDLGQTVSQGSDVTLYLKYHIDGGSSTPVADVDGSINNSGPFTDLATFSSLTTSIVGYTYTVNQVGGLRYLRITPGIISGNATDQYVDMDALEFTVCGNAQPNTLSGNVFNDVNNNTTFEAPDFGEQNVTVNLYEDVNQNGILDGPDLILQSTSTAVDGTYSFSITPATTTGTYSQRVLASADDAESDNDGTKVKINNGSLGLSSKLDAVRFQNITIPAGSTITNAYLQFTASAPGNQNPSSVLISGEQNSNPAAFVEVDGNILDRTPTTNSSSWTIPTFSNNSTYNSPDLSTIVQELVDDYSGYSNGNMVFLLESVQGQTRTAYAWDADPASATQLVIEYTQPAGSNYYITTVDQATLPAGYAWTTDNIETAVFTGGGNINSNNNFGFYDATLNYISGNIFKDMNTNAVNDTPDEGQTAVTVNLYDDINEDGLVDGGDILITTTSSDVSGAYVFALDNDYSTSGSYSQRVVASTDDAEESSSGNVVVDDPKLPIGQNRTIGMRFQNISLPDGATITSAYIDFTAESSASNNTSSVTISGESNLSPDPFVVVDDDITGRSKTTNTVNWTLGSWSSENTYQSPDITAIVQEIYDLNPANWNNAEMLIMMDPTGSKNRDAYSYDNDPSKAPLLVINWTRPAPDYHYVIETDINTLPPGSSLTTDNIETANFTASGQTDVNNDFGFEPDHLISGTVYEDVNFSGVFDGGDNGQDNVTVYLYNDVNQDGILNGGDTVVDSIDTYTGGAFYFAPILNTSTQDTSQVNAIADDAEEILSNGSMDLISSDLELISEAGTDQIVGMRFTNVAIPQGATITNALVEFEVDELDSGVTNLIFSGEDIDDAPSFTTTSYDISSRTKTTSTVTWSNVPAWDTESEKKQSPSIAGIIQEIVNRPGWVSGNDIVILVEGSGERTAEAFEGEPANAPKLIYSWSEGTLPAYYLLTIDKNDLPGSGYLVTDNLEATAFTTSNQSDSGNDFGFVLNTAPTANDDTESTPEDTPLVSNVLSNDTDVESNIDPTSVLIISAATNGTLSVNPTTGVVTYTPNPDFNGADQYSYSVCDDYSLCDTAIVFITVTPINDDPVATDNSFTVSYNTANQALDVLDAAVADYDVEGNTLQITGAGTDASNGVTTQGGTVVINNNGTPGDYTDDFIDYTPMNGFVGMDTFLYQISDGLGGTDTATVTLTVLSTTEIDCGNGFDDDGDGMLDCDDPDCTPVIPTGISRY